MTDLDLVRGEATPRSDATCRRVARRVNSISGLIGHAALTLLLGSCVSTAVLFGGMAATGTKPGEAVTGLVLLAWLAAFVVPWILFGSWVARRRHAARTLVQRGVLVEGRVENPGTPTRTAAIRFDADGGHYRAVFSARPRDVAPGGTESVLFLPGAQYAVVFVAGRVYAGRLARDIVLDSAHGRADVTMARGTTEKILVAILALVLVEAVGMSVRVAVFKDSAELRCERERDSCTLSGADVFGSTWSSSFAASAMTGSTVDSNRYDELTWSVRMRDGKTQQIGNPTARTRQQEQYRQGSIALAAFIADPTQRSFDARFESLGGPSGTFWGVFVAVLAFIFVRLIHGWRTTLVFDRFSGQLTITRRPSLWPSRRTLPLTAVARAEGRIGSIWVLYAALPTLTIILRDQEGKVVFSRRQLTSDDGTRELAAINEILRAPLARRAL